MTGVREKDDFDQVFLLRVMLWVIKMVRQNTWLLFFLFFFSPVIAGADTYGEKLCSGTQFDCRTVEKGETWDGSPDVPGRNASHGCIRLFPEDAQWMNEEFVEPGDRVEVLP